MHRARQLPLRVCSTLLFLSTSTAAVRAAAYTLTDLGALSGVMNTSAVAINNDGTVLGVTTNSADNTQTTFTYSNGAFTYYSVPGTLSTSATSINNAGQFAGIDIQSSGDVHSFLYDGSSHDLGDLGVAYTFAYGINNSGQVVGNATTPSGSVAFLYANGQISGLPLPVGYSYSAAYGINNKGVIAGTMSTSSGPSHIMLYDDATHDLGTLGGDFGQANAINDDGDLTGISTNAAGNEDAFLYDGTSLKDLGTLGGSFSQGNAINIHDVIVGNSGLASGQVGHAFIDDGTSMIDLNTLISPADGFTLDSATGINDDGDIVGYGTDANGNQHAFLLTLSAVPEPASVLFALPVVASVLRRRVRGVNL